MWGGWAEVGGPLDLSFRPSIRFVYFSLYSLVAYTRRSGNRTLFKIVGWGGVGRVGFSPRLRFMKFAM